MSVVLFCLIVMEKKPRRLAKVRLRHLAGVEVLSFWKSEKERMRESRKRRKEEHSVETALS